MSASTPPNPSSECLEDLLGGSDGIAVPVQGRLVGGQRCGNAQPAPLRLDERVHGHPAGPGAPGPLRPPRGRDISTGWRAVARAGSTSDMQRMLPRRRHRSL